MKDENEFDWQQRVSPGEKMKNPKKIEKKKNPKKQKKEKFKKKRAKSKKSEKEKSKKKGKKEKELVSSSLGQNMRLLSLPYS